MSYGWLFVILWAVGVLTCIIGATVWMNRPMDEYDRVLAEIMKEKKGGAKNGN